VSREPASAEAYLRLEQRPPDVILATDLPAGEGHVIDQCAELRRHLGPDRGVIVIARDGAGDWRVSEDLLAVLGIDACLGLPLDPRKLLRRLEHALRVRLGRTVALLERPGTPEAESWLAKGTERYRRGEVGPAIEAFERGLARDPEHVALLASLAVARVKQGQIFAAADALERALQIDPVQVTVARNLAQLYERRGFRFQAIEAWERALKLTAEAERRQEILRHLEELWRA
jgi:tetratricopeptide (TPR) repeat protein